MSRPNGLLPVACAVVLAVALVARVVSLGMPFWADEAFSAQLVSQPTTKLLELCRAEPHPPGYYLVLKTWNELGWRLNGRAAFQSPWIDVSYSAPRMAVAAPFTLRASDGRVTQRYGVQPAEWSEWRLMPLEFLRLPSALMGVVCVALLWWIAAQLYPDRPAIRIVASALAALSPFFLSWDALIRSYPWFTACFLLAVAAGLWGGDRARWAVAGPVVAIASAAALLFHYAPLVFLPCLGLALWARERWRPRGLIGAACIAAGAAIAFLVWGRVFMAQRALAPAETLRWAALPGRFLATAGEYGSGFWQVLLPTDLASHDAIHTRSWFFYPALVLCATGLVAGIAALAKSRDRGDWFVAILAFAPFALVIVADSLRPGAVPFLPRHFHSIAPFVLLLIARSWTRSVAGIRHAPDESRAAPRLP